MSWPKPLIASVIGITPKIANAKQAKMEVVARGIISVIYRMRVMPRIIRVIMLGSTGKLLFNAHIT